MATAVITRTGTNPTETFTVLATCLGDAQTVASDLIEISGDWTSTTDTTAAIVADDNLTIRCKAADEARHAGVDNAGTNYELAVSAAHCITVNNTGAIIDGMIIRQAGTGASDECIRMAASGGTLTVINTILIAPNNTSDQDGVYAGAISCTVNCENVCAIGFGRAGFHPQPTTDSVTQTWNLISCTAWNCGRNSGEADGGGISAYMNFNNTININAHNCCFVVNTAESSEDYNDDGNTTATVNWQLDNCIASDASITTAHDAGATNPHESVTTVEGNPAAGELGFIDITSAPYDLRLFDDSADNVAQDDHTNATGATLTIGAYAGSAVDVAGTARPQNTNYDIGFFEVVAAAAGGYKNYGQLMSLGVG